jgi:hypothetical protein
MIAALKEFFSQFIEPGARPPEDREQALRVATAAQLLEMMRMDSRIDEAERNAIAAALRQQADGCFNATYGGDAITMFQQARGFGLMQRYKVVCDAANEFLVARGMKQQLPPQWTGMHWYAAATARLGNVLTGLAAGRFYPGQGETA